VGVFHYFFTGGLNITIILLCLASIGYSIYSEVKAYQKEKMQGGAPA
jgi:putative tricarboxylic transport membrane protein